MGSAMAKRALLGSLLILFGILLFLSQIGVVSYTVWLRLFDLWPLVLIGLGLVLIFRRGSLGLLGPLVLIGLILFAALVPFHAYEQISGHYSQVLMRHEGIREGYLSMDVGATNMKVQALGEGSRDILTASGYYLAGQPLFEESIQGARADIRMVSQGWDKVSRIVPRFGRLSEVRDDIRLNRDVVWSLDVNVGASNLDLDLSSLMVSDLSVKTGASSVALRLGDRINRLSVSIHTGVSSVSVSIPRRVGVRVEKSTPLSSDNLSKLGFVSRDGFLFSDNYGTAAQIVDIELKGGLSSFELTYSH